MLRILPVLLFLLISGCQSVNVSISHANTDKGFLNSRQLDVGQLFLLDTSDDTLVPLSLLNLKTVKSANRFASVKATDISGVTVNGSADAAVVASVKLEVANKAFVELTNANRIQYTSVYNDLSRAIETEISNGNDVGNRWYLEDAAARNSKLRLVLVTGAFAADTGKIGFDNSTNVNGSISIPVGRRGTLDVKINKSSIEEIVGKGVPVLLDLSVIEVFYNQNGNFDFRPDRRFRSPERLTAALRNL